MTARAWRPGLPSLSAIMRLHFARGESCAVLLAIRPLLELTHAGRCQLKSEVAVSGFVSVSMKFDAHVLPSQAPRA